MFIKTRKSWLEYPAIVFFLFIFLVLLIRVFLRGQILEIDEAEQVFQAQQLLPGYHEQPPLYSWLQYGVFKVLGIHLVSLSLLKSILLFASLYCFHQICRLHCQSSSLAWCATLAWALIPSISLDLIKDNTHSILALFAANLTWYWFVAPLRLPRTVCYVLLGCIISVGVLSKFNYLLFLAILLISLISLPSHRNKLFSFPMLLSLLIAFLIASPYISWFVQYPNIGLEGSYKLVPANQQGWHGVIDIIKASLLFVAPILLVVSIFFPIKQGSTQQSPINLLLIRYHLISLPFLIIAILLGGVRNFETRWLIPIFFLCPVLYFSQVEAKGELEKKVRSFLLLCVLVEFLLLIALILRSHGKKHNSFPFAQIVQTMQREHEQPDYVVSDNYWLLGNLMLGLSIHNGRLMNRAEKPKLPQGNSLLIWRSTNPPFWIADLAKLGPLGEIKLLKDSKSQEILGGYILYKS
jgi:4-amino-4-deoxy-L-arabinose transferase-like glycosyltransferase